ncbi:hypothetical protein [Thalassovita taeanensis]|uniref:DUF2946 domain-containing protein n=1 Tax=Thalassovita taeanensis TaxID=657014 RepID=A0A1H9DFE5_9RHOB|nr:hypothetical protein [Thalassovita taeanensis]SEQ12101.1 hypothetical protein SAMN04488092_104132 [Thalassovita taeanensis]
MRPFLALTLALMLALTGQAMAVARGMPPAAGGMVLCTGTGPVSVLVDADGQPVGPPHICPDCALSLFVALAQDPPFVLRPVGGVVVLHVEAVGNAEGLLAIPATARGPPVLV